MSRRAGPATVAGMSEPAEIRRQVSQHGADINAIYELLDETNKTVRAISVTQRRHTSRLDEIQAGLDLNNGRLERLEGGQRLTNAALADQGAKLDAILELLRQR